MEFVMGQIRRELRAGEEWWVVYQQAVELNQARRGPFVSPYINLSAYYNRTGDSERALDYARPGLSGQGNIRTILLGCLKSFFYTMPAAAAGPGTLCPCRRAWHT